MRHEDFDEFAQLLDDAYDLIGKGAGKVISAGAKGMFFAALAKYQLSAVRAALSAHCTDPVRGRFTPVPADIIEQIEGKAAHDGRPGAEEAWAIALTSRDEAETVVWTLECHQAFGICRSVLDNGDEVGARMAFKDAYNRLVTQARAEGQPAQWSASLGWDKEKQTAVLKRAATAGLLPAPTVAALLPAPAGETAASGDIDAQKQLEAIAKMLAEGDKARQARAERMAEERKAAEMAVDAEIAMKTEEFLARTPRVPLPSKRTMP